MVPALSFGENSIYKEVDLSGLFGRLAKYWIKRFWNIDLVIPNGRGIFGLIPFRRPITTVIGAPIHLKKTPNPSTDEIDQTHTLFCKQLNELFEMNKSKYVDNYESVHLEII